MALRVAESATPLTGSRNPSTSLRALCTQRIYSEPAGKGSAGYGSGPAPKPPPRRPRPPGKGGETGGGNRGGFLVSRGGGRGGAPAVWAHPRAQTPPR